MLTPAFEYGSLFLDDLLIYNDKVSKKLFLACFASCFQSSDMVSREFPSISSKAFIHLNDYTNIKNGLNLS